MSAAASDAASPGSPPRAAALPANSSFYLQSLLPGSRMRSFPLPLLCALSLALLFLSFVFLPSLSSWLLSLAAGVLRLLLFVAVLLLCALWWCQGSLLYMPSFMGRHSVQRSPSYNSPGFQCPSEHSLPFTSHLIACPDGVHIHAWLLLQADSLHRPTLIFYHGNAGNIGFRLPNASSLYRLCQLNVLMLEYRGFGDSAGSPSEAGLALDGLTALHWLRQQRHVVDPSNVFLFGRSLGGAVAIHVAAAAAKLQQRSSPSFPPLVRGLVVENSFTSVDDMVVTLALRVVRLSGPSMRLLRWALRLFMTSHWNSEGKAADVRCPALLISGEKDELVPPWQMRRLQEKMGGGQGERARLLLIPNGTHNTTYIDGGAEYWTQLSAFIELQQQGSSSSSSSGAATPDSHSQQQQHPQHAASHPSHAPQHPHTHSAHSALSAGAAAAGSGGV